MCCSRIQSFLFLGVMVLSAACTRSGPLLLSEELSWRSSNFEHVITAKQSGLHYIVLETDRSQSGREVLCLFDIGSSEANRLRYGCHTAGKIDSEILWEVFQGNQRIAHNQGKASHYRNRGYFLPEHIGKVLGWFCTSSGKEYRIKATLLRQMPELFTASPQLRIGHQESGLVSGLVANLDGEKAPRCEK